MRLTSDIETYERENPEKTARGFASLSAALIGTDTPRFTEPSPAYMSFMDTAIDLGYGRDFDDAA